MKACLSCITTDMRNYDESEPSAQLRNPVLRRSQELAIGEPVNWPSDLQPKVNDTRQ